jgi:hypothetical protein
MKTKIKVQDKAKLISCLLLLFVLNCNLFAQIIYTDITDASPNASYSLDLNNDTIIDFILHYGGSSMTIGVICQPQNSNAYAGNFVSGNYLPWALAASSTICPSTATWYDTNNPGTLGWGTNLGYWVGETDKYLALKIIVGTNTYYGWARLDLQATSSSFTIKDYAYQSTANTCILSGQTNLGTTENYPQSLVSIFPKPLIDRATLQSSGQLNNATLTLYNNCGQTVKEINNISEQTISIYRDHLKSGLYFIMLTEENKIIATKKLLISD